MNALCTARRKTAVIAMASALSGLMSAISPASAEPAAPAAYCPGGTHIIYSGHHIGCEMDGQDHSPWQYWAGGRKTIAVVGVGYLTYYAVNDGPWRRLGNGQASPDGGGIFFKVDLWGGHEDLSTAGHYYVLGTDGHTRWCINFADDPDTPTSDWYYAGCTT